MDTIYAMPQLCYSMPMHEKHLKKLLDQIANGSLDTKAAMHQLRHLPLEELDCARLDHHRHLRTGIPEAVFGQGKSSEQLISILKAMLAQKNVALATRVLEDKAEKICSTLPELTYDAKARILFGNKQYSEPADSRGTIVVITAGTSDQPVAEEAGISLELFGHPVQRIYDAGVAGIHRILAHSETLQKASVVIVAAGMEGALPSVVAGLTPAPVIGVPTSVGYGTGTGGFSALLGMLNSCAPGLAVVNIDNGFGAACMAAAINTSRHL